jgi:hypothetical protein
LRNAKTQPQLRPRRMTENTPRPNGEDRIRHRDFG